MDHAHIPHSPRSSGARILYNSSSVCAEKKPSRPATFATPASDLDRARELDQFFTREDVAEYLLKHLRRHVVFESSLFIEPSAGTGSFYLRLPPGSIGFDIDVQCPGVIEANFLSVTLPGHPRIVVVGNPPFGRACSLAIPFFNHAATFAHTIGFILPLTFMKVSIQNRLNLDFHLVEEIALPDKAFIFHGKPKHVPTVFQIWQRRDPPRRKLILPTTHPDFDFVDDPRDADFAIQRVGKDAGSIVDNLEQELKSHYFIRANKRGVLRRMRKLNFRDLAARTAGNPSLAKTEIVSAYAQAIGHF